MAPAKTQSSLKRTRVSVGEPETPELKKPRRSQRVASQRQDVNEPGLPSPLTNTIDTPRKEGTLTPPEGRPSQITHRPPVPSPPLSPDQFSGLSDTQPFSQIVQPPQGLSNDVKDENSEGVWGYLIPLDRKFGDTLVLKRRAACPLPDSTHLKVDSKKRKGKTELEDREKQYEESKIRGISSGGYLIGRHPECDRVLNVPTVSNRHCLIYHENKGGSTIAILEDLSGNGTFVNESCVGRNKRRELYEGDEIAVLDEARFIFRYSRSRDGQGFRQQFVIQQQLGKGHFATVYLCVERATGIRYAVKKFEKRTGPGESARLEGLQQEIAVLMGVSHPNVLCLKDAFVEHDGVYIVLELAPEGELFNHIIRKQKLSEAESRKLFIQLFQGIKYLHERNIVHRDIKPENILLVDNEPSVKLADFGLSKIIGEESFTTTLCGTPSYVAPEILQNSNHRRYTKAVDVWSLGVVLYICLCGFPPFSEELYSAENPYTLHDQIKSGRFDYPSPYWDPVSDLALELIDRMLTVDVEKRISIDGCLEHPWTTQRPVSLTDSTEGLTGAMNQLDFSKRKMHRERTLLSNLNDVKVTELLQTEEGEQPVKVFSKNAAKETEGGGASDRNLRDFMEVGAQGDEPLYQGDPTTIMK